MIAAYRGGRSALSLCQQWGVSGTWLYSKFAEWGVETRTQARVRQMKQTDALGVRRAVDLPNIPEATAPGAGDDAVLEWRVRRAAGAAWPGTAVGIGPRISLRVRRVVAEEGVLFAKTGTETGREAACLRWMARQEIRAARLVHHSPPTGVLFTGAVPGPSLGSYLLAAPARTADLLRAALAEAGLLGRADEPLPVSITHADVPAGLRSAFLARMPAWRRLAVVGRIGPVRRRLLTCLIDAAAPLAGTEELGPERHLHHGQLTPSHVRGVLDAPVLLSPLLRYAPDDDDLVQLVAHVLLLAARHRDGNVRDRIVTGVEEVAMDRARQVGRCSRDAGHLWVDGLVTRCLMEVAIHTTIGLTTREPSVRDDAEFIRQTTRIVEFISRTVRAHRTSGPARAWEAILAQTREAHL
ncbi:hypothetical protein [Streptomyces sp. NPDC049881]|uniref:hypothetical protein n=1 Tax=Streptomyces sp. NPDC049881 TaxID=3155778 RepID=UPI003431E9B9